MLKISRTQLLAFEAASMQRYAEGCAKDFSVQFPIWLPEKTFVEKTEAVLDLIKYCNRFKITRSDTIRYFLEHTIGHRISLPLPSEWAQQLDGTAATQQQRVEQFLVHYLSGRQFLEQIFLQP